jgi:flagellar biosynthesis/type III secretory pathway protein FliH
MPSEVLTDCESPTPVLWPSAARLAAARPRNTGAQAEQAIASRLEQARREGFASGVLSGQQDAERDLLPAAQKIADRLAELARMRDTLRKQALGDLVRLALGMASRVFHREEAAVDPDVLAGLLNAAFSKLQSEENSRARIHPGFEPMVRRCLEPNEVPVNLLLIPDSRMKLGELVFENDAASAPAEAAITELERGLTAKR